MGSWSSEEISQIQARAARILLLAISICISLLHFQRTRPRVLTKRLILDYNNDRTTFFLRSVSLKVWNWCHGDFMLSPTEYHHIVSSFIHDIIVVLPRAAEKDMTSVHVKYITKYIFFVVLSDRDRYFASLQYSNLWTAFYPSKRIRCIERFRW